MVSIPALNSEILLDWVRVLDARIENAHANPFPDWIELD